MAQVRVETLDGAGDDHLGVVVGVGDGVLEQRVHGRDELAPVTEDGHRGRGLVQDDLDAALVGGGPHPLDGVGHDQVDQDGLAGGASSDSMRDRSSRSSMMRLTRKASLWMRPARRWATSGSGSETSVSARRPERAHRRLQLMAHVGHEVAADLLEPAPLRDVLDERDDPSGRRPSSIWRARTCSVRRGGP